jgi:Ca-activated chloride channel family protein
MQQDKWPTKSGRTSKRAHGRVMWHPCIPKAAAARMPKLLRQQASWRWLAILLLVIKAPGVPAQTHDDPSSEVSPAQVRSGSLLLRMQSGYEIATRMNTDIETQISGLVARVSVRQEFQNSGQEWVEGVYVFPLPDNAAVDRLRMHIGERFIEGEIREKEAAKREYEAAKTAGKKASLVEQQRTNMFTTSVANIGPGETVAIEIEYLQTVSYDEGSFSLRFPLTVTPRFIPGTPLPGRKGSGWSADTDRVPDASLVTPPMVTTSTDHRVTFRAGINAGVPLEFIASRYHPISVREDKEHYTIELSGTDVPLDHDLELTWRPVPASAPRAMMFSETLGGQPHVLLMMLPPNDLAAPTTKMPRELIFVVDTSGSMHGTSLSQATRALTLALDGLRPADLFNVIQFNSLTHTLFPHSVSATARNINIAKRYVAGLAANGGTQMRPAIEQALLSPPSESHLRQVIFITDGSVGNEEELFRLIERNLGNTRMFTVGIGSAPNSWFMRKAAEAGRGTFTFISALHEVNEKMTRLFRKLEQPQITDVVVEWPNNPQLASYPQVIPDLYMGEPIVVKVRLENALQTGELVKISGNSATGTWGAELDADAGKESPGVAALWARARIEDLQDRQRRGADADETRSAVIETALAHHLVSKHTSLVAVDKTPVRPSTSALNQEQVPNLLPYGQSNLALFGFTATATNAGVYRLSGLALIVFAIFLMLILSLQGRDRVAAYSQ